MKYGVQLYTLRDQIKDAQGLSDTFSFLHQCGCETVELASMPPVTTELLVQLSANNQVGICSSHSSFKEINKNIVSLVTTHMAYGADFISMGGMPHKYTRTIRGIKKFAKLLNQANHEAKKQGLRMCYHNHAMEFEKRKGVPIFDILLEEMEPDVGFCLDCYWAHVAGQDVNKLIEKIGNRLFLLHFKDCMETKNGPQICRLGQGNLDFVSYIQQAEQLGVQYCLVELDDSNNPKEDVRLSLEYLRQLPNDR